MAIEKSLKTVKDRLAQLRDDLGLPSYEALSHMLGLHGNTIASYASGVRNIGPDKCLMLAGLSKRPGDRDFWIELSGLKPEQLRIVARGLGIEGIAPSADFLSGVSDLISRPRSRAEADLVALLRSIVEERANQ